MLFVTSFWIKKEQDYYGKIKKIFREINCM